MKRYADAEAARLDAALSRFPAVAPFLEITSVADLVAAPTAADLRQRAALTTDAVARVAVLKYSGVADPRAADRAVADVSASVEIKMFRIRSSWSPCGTDLW